MTEKKSRVETITGRLRNPHLFRGRGQRAKAGWPLMEQISEKEKVCWGVGVGREPGLGTSSICLRGF